MKARKEINMSNINNVSISSKVKSTCSAESISLEKVNKLLDSGWTRLYMKSYQRNELNKLDIQEDNFIVFHRERSISKSTNKGYAISTNLGAKTNLHPKSVYDQNSQSLIDKGTPTFNIRVSNKPMGEQKYDVTPLRRDLCSPFDNIPSIRNMRLDKHSFCIGFDTEFYSIADDYDNLSKRFKNFKRKILSWQFSFILPNDYDTVHELIVFSKDDELLKLSRIISFILEEFEVYPSFDRGHDCYRSKNGYSFRSTRYWRVPSFSCGQYKLKKFKTFNEAVNNCIPGDYKNALMDAGEYHRAPYESDIFDNRVYTETIYVYEVDEEVPLGYMNDFTESNKNAVNITLVCHSGKADLSTFNTDGNEVDLLRKLTEVHGGLCTRNSFNMRVPVYTITNDKNFYPVRMNVRDTMCFCPDKKKKLEDIGKVIGIDKIEIDETRFNKAEMNKVLEEDPCMFSEYAVTDATIALVYSSELWGCNMEMPVTLASAAVNAALPIIYKCFDVDNVGGDKNKDLFDRRFRGIKKVDLGMVETSAGLKHNYEMRAINDECDMIQTYARKSYKGGYNGSMKIGFFDNTTYDYDLKNAYPTCMSLIPDVDWECERVLIMDEKDVKITMDMLMYPFSPIFAYATVTFPERVKFPCVADSVDGNLIFSYNQNEGIYMSCPEMWLALKLGATIRASRIIKARTRFDEEGNPSYSLAKAVKQFVNDRAMVEQCFGKNILSMLLKEGVNALYGKIAQNVINKSAWSVRDNTMVNIGDSSITSPVHCAITTAGVRCAIIAAMNQLADLGYNIYSVTTDGFITDAPEDVLKGLDLYGFAAYFRSSREWLVGNPEMWEMKHKQNDLLNLTTRGNVSASAEGVIAHNSYVTGEDPDSEEDRVAFGYCCLTRTGRIVNYGVRFAKFKDMTSVENRIDFYASENERRISMDFDMKRKPIKNSFIPKYVKTVIDENGHSCFVETSSDDKDAFEIACFETVPYTDTKEYVFYKSKSRGIKVLKTMNDWAAFFNKIRVAQSGSSSRCSNINRSIVISCIMAYRLGMPLACIGNSAPVIPYLNDKSHSLPDKIKWINSFASNAKFTVNDWKNCSRKDRIKYMLPEDMFSDMIKRMMSYDPLLISVS